MAGGPWAKVFAKLNARREGTGCSPANQLHLQAVFINYDREARRQLVGGGEVRAAAASLEKRAKRFGPGRLSQVNDSNLSPAHARCMRRHQLLLTLLLLPAGLCCMQLIEERHHQQQQPHRDDHHDDLGSRQLAELQVLCH